MEGKEVKPKFKKGFWKPEEDMILKKYVETHGEGNWTAVSKKSGLLRGAKSCRLRWKNYLRPNIKRGMISEDERDLIIRLHKLLGNRWSLIAGRLPGRTDNEVKNYWNTHLNKRASRDQSDRDKRKLSVLSSHDEHTTKQEAELGDIHGVHVEDKLKIDVNDDYTMDIVMTPQVLISPDAPDYSPLFFDNYEAFCMPVMDPFEDHLMRETILESLHF